MADEKAGDMDFNFSDANFDMGGADGGDAFEMPSMDELGGGGGGGDGGDFKFDAGDDGGFNFGEAGGEPGGDFNFDNMSMPSFSGGDEADAKDDAASKPGKTTDGGASAPTVAADAMADDPLNTIVDLPEMPDIGAPMSLVELSQGEHTAEPPGASQDNKSSQGSHTAGGASSQPKSQGSTRSSRRRSTRNSTKSSGSAKETKAGGAAKKRGASKQAAAKSHGAVAATPAKKRGRVPPIDEEQKDTPSKDVVMANAAAADTASGSKRKAVGSAVDGSGKKKPKTPEHPVHTGSRSKGGTGESLRATKDMMRGSGASAAAAAPGAGASSKVPQTPSDAQDKKSSHHRNSSNKSRSSKKRSQSHSSSGGSGAPTASSSSSQHKNSSGDNLKKHKSKPGSNGSSPDNKEGSAPGSATEEVSLQQIVTEAQARMNEITEAMTRIEKELHQKTSQLATNFVQSMFGMCNNFGMTCQQQILVMNQVAYRNDQLRKNVCKALELSNRLRGMQQMKSQLSSIKDSFCPNL